MAERIKYEDAAKATVFNALIGNCLTEFSIEYMSDNTYQYVVGEMVVSREVYKDALELAQADRFDPMNRMFEGSSKAMPPPAPPSDKVS